MNWIYKFQQILGKFWSVVFSEQNFTLGVKKLHSFFSLRRQGQYDSWSAGQVVAGKAVFDTHIPFTIYLSKAKLGDIGGAQGFVSTVVHPAASWDDILDGTAELDDRDDNGGYVVQSRFNFLEPHHITDHVSDYGHTFFNHADYDCVDGAILFHFDPSALNLPEVCVTDSDGVLHIYWKLFGWLAPHAAMKDPVAAFESPALNPYAEVVWDIHQNGADFLNSRTLLGEVTDSVICQKDGAVDAIWQEQSERCMLVGDKVYHAPLSTSCNFAEGDSVKAGDTLFGTLKMISSNDMPDTIPASVAPGVRVMTDVGGLVAVNADMQAVATDKGNVLPLVKDYGFNADIAYVNMCEQLMEDPRCITLEVPDTVNPFMFVMRDMRRGSGILASMTVDPKMPIAEALACIRKSINASAIMTVYLQAEGDIVGEIPSRFTATAGHAAVAVDATETVIDMFAEAEIVI